MSTEPDNKLLHYAPRVIADDVWAKLLYFTGGFFKDSLIMAEDLEDHCRILQGVETKHFQRTLVAVQNAVGRHKLGVAHGRTVLAANEAVGFVRKTGHRR